MRKLFLLLCVVNVGDLYGQDLGAYTSYIPAGITLNMSVEQVRAARPKVFLADSVFTDLADSAQEFELLDKLDAPGPFEFAHYRFKARRLVGIGWRYSGVNAADLLVKLRTQMLAGFTKESDGQWKVLLNDQKVMKPLELWRSPGGNTKAYILSATPGGQVFIFDSTKATKADLFIDVDSL